MKKSSREEEIRGQNEPNRRGDSGETLPSCENSKFLVQCEHVYGFFDMCIAK